MGEENERFCFYGKNIVGESEMFLRRCNGFGGIGVGGGGDDDVECMEVDDREEEREGDSEDEPQGMEVDQGDFSIVMGGGTTNNHFQGIETVQIPYNGLFGSTAQTNSIQASSSQFVNGHDYNVISRSRKRMASNDDHRPSCSNKRMRTGGLDFDFRGGGSEFETCMEQLQHWMGRARVMYMEKEKACEELSRSRQFLLGELRRRQAENEQLRATIQRVEQARQAEVDRYQQELHFMRNLIIGYRNALNL